jgi:hypothetical protein
MEATDRASVNDTKMYRGRRVFSLQRHTNQHAQTREVV